MRRDVADLLAALAAGGGPPRDRHDHELTEMPAPRPKVVVVWGDAVRRLLADPAAKEKFPELADPPMRACRACERRRGGPVERPDEAAVACLLHDLPDGRRAELAAHLGADRLVLRCQRAGRSLQASWPAPAAD